jgi:hypothetical protein
MKPNLLIAILTLAMTAAWSDASAATDRSYYVTELTIQQRFDVYNDGRNTYLESIPGLVVTGATADGERYIVNGVPQQIRGFMNGKPITVIRGLPPAPKPAAPDTTAVSSKIAELTKKIESLTAQVKPAASVTEASSASTVGTPNSASMNSAPKALPSAQAVIPAALSASVETRSAGAPVATLRKPTSPTDQVQSFTVAPSDHVLRLVVERYARMVGWNAVWDVERDIPIGNSGEKTTDFKSAVRWILTATELGDLTVKPCFYNNAVVRVVRKTVKCNPNE